MFNSRFWMAAASLLIVAGCTVSPDTDPMPEPKETTAAPEFSPLAARAFMDSVNLVSPGRVSPVFSPDGSRIAFETAGRLVVVEAATGQEIVSWTDEQLAQMVDTPMSSLTVSLQNDPFQAFLTFEGAAATLALQPGATPMPADPIDPPRMVRSMFPMNGYDRRENRSPDGRLFASLDGQDLAVRRAGMDTARRLTLERDPGRVWFHGNDIWERSGSIWAPDSARFVARLHDTSQTPGIDLIDYLEDGDDASIWNYWARAGQPLPRTELYVVDAVTGARTRLGPPGTHDDHLFFIEWSPGGDSVLAMRYARDLSKQEVFKIDTATSEVQTLDVRTAKDAWVKWPGGPQTIRHLSGGGYLLRSDESGFFHYYRLGADGRVIAQLTDGDVDVGGVIGVAPDDGGQLLYYRPVSPDRPYDQIPHRVSLDGGPSTALSDQPGVHRATLAPDGAHLVTVHSDYNRASRADLISLDGAFIATLAETQTPEDLAGLPLPEPFTVRAADGETVMHGTLIKPRDFDPGRSYPVIHRVYGAMQSRAQRSGFWPEGLGYPGAEYHTMLTYLANSGYVIVMIDAPGSPGRGRDYNLVHWGNWPGTTADDYAAGLMELASTRPWMDTSRIGVDGNSWGGYVALYSALERPDIYRTASISVPETDFIDHVHWIEWQLGRPEDNPDVYREGRLADRAGELESELIIVSGTADVNVPISNTMKLLDGLAEAGKPYDLVLFPGTNHPHQGRGDRYAYAVERIRVFHDAHLKDRP